MLLCNWPQESPPSGALQAHQARTFQPDMMSLERFAGGLSESLSRVVLASTLASRTPSLASAHILEYPDVSKILRPGFLERFHSAIASSHDDVADDEGDRYSSLRHIAFQMGASLTCSANCAACDFHRDKKGGRRQYPALTREEVHTLLQLT